MTRNPNTRVGELHATDKHKDALTVGSLFAAGFILVVSFIAKRFYQ